MSGSIVTDIARRHDFILLFDVSDGNPNGDPDAGNLPRVDPETMQGLVTDVAIKRKVRDWVLADRQGKPPYNIYVQSGGDALNTLHQKAYDATGNKSTGSKQARGDIQQARAWMCEQYYDIRLFGAVMTTGVNCGQVRGPAQLTFARSIDPIVPLDLSITRVAVTKPEDAAVVVSEDGATGSGGKQTEMGRKALVPYGLYLSRGFFNPHFAKQTGATEEDLSTLWNALRRMWDLDRSASRGMTACRGLYVFSHSSTLGDAPAHELFDRIAVRRREGVTAPRAFSDYAVSVSGADMPTGVTLTVLEGPR